MSDPNSHQLTDELHLMQRIAQQDQSALSDLYDRYARILLGLACKMLGSVEDAEEVVLDVFSQIWRTAKSYDPHRGQVEAWLFLLTRSRALDKIRSQRRALRTLITLETFREGSSTFTSGPEDHVLQTERQSAVRSALGKIPPEQSEVILLAYFNGWTQARIAEHLNVPIGTVKTRLRLGLSKLRALLPLDSQGGNSHYTGT
ncbi:MAG: sigma-70 family RNA polymerase sigma factor [Synechococcaceae cyanobacterium SM2_3_1]|nr:sigma-70 family RNA polymerase sigma factor [Synechococcaceae cyanobacterium SM2_3_1]